MTWSDESLDKKGVRGLHKTQISNLHHSHHYLSIPSASLPPYFSFNGLRIDENEPRPQQRTYTLTFDM